MNNHWNLQPSPSALYLLADCGLFARPWKEGQQHLRFTGLDGSIGVAYCPTVDLPWALYFPCPTADHVELVHAAKLETILTLYALVTIR